MVCGKGRGQAAVGVAAAAHTTHTLAQERQQAGGGAWKVGGVIN